MNYEVIHCCIIVNKRLRTKQMSTNRGLNKFGTDNRILYSLKSRGSFQCTDMEKSCTSQGSPEKQPMGNRDRHIYCKELAHMIVKAGKLQDL